MNTCNFGDYLDTVLRDQLVYGLKDHKAQDSERTALHERAVVDPGD